MTDDMNRVRFAHEEIHERLVNWGRWCMSGARGPGASPMFRQYKAPKYRNAVDELSIPVDGLDATKIERAVSFLPEKHRDSIRWFYVYSRAGMGLWQAVRALGVQRDTLTKLIHDGRSMLRNRLDMVAVPCVIIPAQSEPASAAPVSPSEAQVSARQERPSAKTAKELHPA